MESLDELPMTPALADWTTRNVLSAGSLLGKSCKGTLKLAGQGKRSFWIEKMGNALYLAYER
jgi:hypothetical protein